MTFQSFPFPHSGAGRIFFVYEYGVVWFERPDGLIDD